MKDAEFTSPRNASVAKIDAWAHAIPKGVLDRLVDLPSGPQSAVLQVITNLRTLFDMDDRFRTMDRFENYTQVLTPIPGLHLGLALVDPNFAENLVRRSNDGLAESVAMHPDRFDGFAGLLPLNDPDRSLVELDRLMQIGALGVQIESSINGVPLDDARYEPIFAKMADLQRPIWLHPVR